MFICLFKMELSNDAIKSVIDDVQSRLLTETSSEKRAALYRSLLFYTEYISRTSRVSAECSLVLRQRYRQVYDSYIDDPCGLANYQEAENRINSGDHHLHQSSHQASDDIYRISAAFKECMRPRERSKDDMSTLVDSLITAENNVQHSKIGQDAFLEFEATQNLEAQQSAARRGSRAVTKSVISGATSGFRVPVTDAGRRSSEMMDQSALIKPKSSDARSAASTNFSTNENVNTISSENSSKPQKGVRDRAKAVVPDGAGFQTARNALVEQQGQLPGNSRADIFSYGTGNKTLGPSRRTPMGKFVVPLPRKEDNLEQQQSYSGAKLDDVPNALKNVEPKMMELMMNEIMDQGPKVGWSDIAGLDFAKQTIMEMVVWPMLRPDIFTGLRGPPKGLLLFGPPGTGKTLIGKCIASQSKATFFCISASSLTSKWVGEGEKLVRALFAAARCYQPSVVFIDEIDSLLAQRSDTEHDSSRKIKTEFLVQLDGAATNSEDRILIVGATNRPQELDEAARRRLVKRLYIPLPDRSARRQIVCNLLGTMRHELTDDHLDQIANKTDGYSGADMANVCKEAALGPIRSVSMDQLEHIAPDQVRPIQVGDFDDALRQVKASVSGADLQSYADWNDRFGSIGASR